MADCVWCGGDLVEHDADWARSCLASLGDAIVETPSPELLAELRTYDQARMLAIAAGGGPRYRGDLDVVYCRLCGCGKNGYAGEPNAVSESCEDSRCACHWGRT